MNDARPGFVDLKCPKCRAVALSFDFDKVYEALRAHPVVKLPPVPRSMIRGAVLAQLEAMAPFWSCGGCSAVSS